MSTKERATSGEVASAKYPGFQEGNPFILATYQEGQDGANSTFAPRCEQEARNSPEPTKSIGTKVSRYPSVRRKVYLKPRNSSHSN